MRTIWEDIAPVVAATEHMQFVPIKQASGEMIEHWEVCDRKVPPTIRLWEAYAIYKKLLDDYGERALLAERNEGVDWKALSHAVRIGNQSIELLTTGNVTFRARQVLVPRLRDDAAHGSRRQSSAWRQVMVESRRLMQNESPDRSELAELVRKSIEWFNSLSPEEQAAHREAQARSWVQGEMGIAADAKPPRMVDGVLTYDSYEDYCA